MASSKRVGGIFHVGGYLTFPLTGETRVWTNPLKAYSPQVFSEGVYDSGRTKMHQAPSADASFCGHLRCFAKEGSGSWKLEVGEMEGGLDYLGFKLVKNLVLSWK